MQSSHPLLDSSLSSVQVFKHLRDASQKRRRFEAARMGKPIPRPPVHHPKCLFMCIQTIAHG